MLSDLQAGAAILAKWRGTFSRTRLRGPAAQGEGGSIQFSSGCPYTCEFCDIPELYGRNPRMKRPAQVELDLLAEASVLSVYFVDDNFIGNQKAELELLPHLVE